MQVIIIKHKNAQIKNTQSKLLLANRDKAAGLVLRHLRFTSIQLPIYVFNKPQVYVHHRVNDLNTG